MRYYDNVILNDSVCYAYTNEHILIVEGCRTDIAIKTNLNINSVLRVTTTKAKKYSYVTIQCVDNHNVIYRFDVEANTFKQFEFDYDGFIVNMTDKYIAICENATDSYKLAEFKIKDSKVNLLNPKTTDRLLLNEKYIVILSSSDKSAKFYDSDFNLMRTINKPLNSYYKAYLLNCYVILTTDKGIQVISVLNGKLTSFDDISSFYLGKADCLTVTYTSKVYEIYDYYLKLIDRISM